jgi:hypothetical protein
VTARGPAFAGGVCSSAVCDSLRCFFAFSCLLRFLAFCRFDKTGAGSTGATYPGADCFSLRRCFLLLYLALFGSSGGVGDWAVGTRGRRL